MPTIKKITPILIVILILAQCAITAYTEEYSYSDAGSLLSEGKLDEAEAILNKKLLLDGKDVTALSMMGEVYRKKGNYNKALKLLNKAISIDPKYPIVYMYKGKLYFSMQKFDEVPAEFNLFMENIRPTVAGPESKEFYLSSLHDITTIYFELKRYDELRLVLDEILKLYPKDQTAIYNLGIYYYVYERNRSKAYNSFSKVIEIDGSNYIAKKARYAIEFIRANPDPRVAPSLSFIDQEYRD